MRGGRYMGQLQLEEIKQFVDILIVGGGIAGLTAAISAKEKNPEAEILIVEKQTAGYGGKANKGGGVLQYFDLENTTPEIFTEYHAHAVGCYLGNQNLLKRYVAMNNEMIDRLESWGVTIPKKRIPTGPMTYIIGVDLNITIQMRRKAEKLGIKIMDKVTISDLLTNQERIAGAVGYSILDGTFYTIMAKGVVLATGSQNYRIAPMWSSGRGDGIAAAYRAGAQMRNPEFGNFAQFYKVHSHQEVVFGENKMYNALGENITKNFRRFPEADISATAVREWYEQMSAGKGPIYLKIDDNGNGLMSIWERPYGVPFWKADHGKAEGLDPECEVIPGLVGEQSPVKVGEDMQSTIAGMYAAGDVCYCGSASPGAVPAPPGRNRGSGILNAVFAGIISGEAVADYVIKAEAPTVNQEQVNKCKDNAYEPLLREEGITAIDVIDEVQKLLCPVENSIYMSQNRLNIALRKLDTIKEMVSKMKADDYHGLLSCHEAEAMVLCAEMQLKAASMRKESRGWFLREDYTLMDNENWLKWIIVKNIDGNMVLDTEDVPIEQYDVQPPRF
jgi:succinate dehydrogenase/fumarate reductase flavoprotein subunit